MTSALALTDAPVEPLFAPPTAAVTLYPGKVMHARLKPFGHRFSYRVFTILIDIDRLDEADGQSRLFAINRAGITSFHERDHLDVESLSATLSAQVRQQLADAGLTRAVARVLLLCYPRILGFVFNPISVYFAYGDDGGLLAAIYEVRNTFGGKHTYVCKVEPGQLTNAGLRQSRTKIFHVSPFIELGATYDFRLLPPGTSVALRILESERGEPLLSATFHGDATPLSSANLGWQLLAVPFVTLKVVAAIHWQALKLWLKGARYIPEGQRPPPVSHTDAKPS
jgi:DUF1365 family protein